MSLFGRRIDQRIASVALVSLSILSGCSDSSAGSGGDDVVGRDISVCELASAGVVEDVVGQQIKSILFWVRSPGDQHELKCSFSFVLSEDLFREVVVTYDYDHYGDIDVGERSTFSSIAEHRSAAPVSVEGVEGQGVTVDNKGRPALVWSYPDGYGVSVVGGRPDPDDPIRQEELDVLIALFERIGSRIPEVASGPDRPVTSYPTRRAS
ncbi:hypothetical protein NSA19_12835 [Actinomyces bowdenii]|uniref:hypothetical protein n=1 Tax=Actinomyces bowdenii TaxID=131109 RepID=UPI00214C43E2|nr:hypothetical protein [Actinomyces bowdenii]MCR2053706.1 hypothetical protein [Actinomyces bowdenii]